MSLPHGKYGRSLNSSNLILCHSFVACKGVLDAKADYAIG